METLIRNIKFTRGNTYPFQVNITGNISEIKNIYFTVKDGDGTKQIEKKLDDGITLNDKSIIVKLKPEDTDELIEEAQYKYDLHINYGLDDEWTPMKGIFTVGWKVTD